MNQPVNEATAAKPRQLLWSQLARGVYCGNFPLRGSLKGFLKGDLYSRVLGFGVCHTMIIIRNPKTSDAKAKSKPVPVPPTPVAPTPAPAATGPEPVAGDKDKKPATETPPVQADVTSSEPELNAASVANFIVNMPPFAWTSRT